MPPTQVFYTELNQFLRPRLALSQKPKALEYGSIAQPKRIVDQLCIIPVVSAQVGAQAISDMLNAAA